MMNKLCLLSGSRQSVCALIISANSRPYCQEFKPIKNPDLQFLKRGTGGRSSFNGQVVTVFGATGFFGRILCNQLGKRGSQIIIPYRCDSDENQVKALKLTGDLGQVLFQQFDLRDRLAIRKAIKYSNVVVNLIGSTFPTRNFSCHDVNVIGAREIAQACREFNIERLIHFSALNVTEHPKRHFIKLLKFLPTKLEGERAVLEEFPNATIFRPANMFGYFDTFLWPLCNRERETLHSIPLYASGKKTIKQPVFVSDVALGVINAINDYSSRGKIYQAVGPDRYYLKDIAEHCAQILQRHRFGRNKLVHNIKFDPIYLLKVLFRRYFQEVFFVKPQFANYTFEQIEIESTTDVVDKNLPTLEDLGVPLTKLEDCIPYLILKFFIEKKQYFRTYDEFLPAEGLGLKSIKEYSF